MGKGDIRGLIVDDAKDCFVLLCRPRNDRRRVGVCHRPPLSSSQ